jgi:3-phenylpropionate/trans-cinnamate dioxygenase ferredoxin subunit
LSGALTSPRPGVYRYARRGEILRCPWHQWEFDLRTGQSWFDPAKVRVRAYDARVESGATLLADRADVAAPAPQPGLEPGPYVAEVYAVAVEHDYVVVELDNGRAGREEAA